MEPSGYLENVDLNLCRYQMSVNVEAPLLLPGIVDTPIWNQLSSNEYSEIIDRNNALKQAGKLLKPEVVAKFLQWLLLNTDQQSFSKGIWDIYDKNHHHYWAGDLIIPSL